MDINEFIFFSVLRLKINFYLKTILNK